MLLKGIFKGQESKPYNFKSKDGDSIVGVSNYCYLEDEDGNGFQSRKVKMPKDFVSNVKVGSVVQWRVDLDNSGRLFFVSDVANKSVHA